MMKQFEMPMLEIEKFDVQDIITTSDVTCPNNMCPGDDE